MPKGIPKSGFNKGWDIKPETRRKISESLKKKPVRYWLGKKRPSPSIETREKMSKNSARHWKGKKRPLLTGPGNPNYTGNDMKKAKRAVLIRDNYTCKTCGHKEEDIMQVDHIKPQRRFPELALEKENMQTLCPNCHARKTKADWRVYGRKLN